MTKRILFSIFCLTLFASSLSAQFAFGLKAGLTTSALEGHDLRLSGDGIDNLAGELKSADYGIQAGLFLRIPLGERLFLQPEATFNTSRANFRLDAPDQDESLVFSERYNNLDFPLLIGYQLGILKLQGGPVGHLYFDQGGDVFTGSGWETALDEFNIGYALGGALDIGPITLDLRYDGNFSRFGQTFSLGGQEFSVDQAAKRWIATIGYRF